MVAMGVGTAVQDLNLLCTKSKAGGWNKIPALAKRALSKYLKSSKQLWGGRKLSGAVARHSKAHTQTKSPLEQKRH